MHPPPPCLRVAPAALAIQNGGGIRQNAGNLLPAGGAAGEVISRLDTLNVLPFDKFLVSVDRADPTAADLNKHGAVLRGRWGRRVTSRWPASATCANLTRLPAKSQAVEVTYTAGTADTADDVVVVDAQGVVADVGPFRIVTNQFTAAGGDDYPTFAALPTTKLTDGTDAQIFYEQSLREYLGSLPAGGGPGPAHDQCRRRALRRVRGRGTHRDRSGPDPRTGGGGDPRPSPPGLVPSAGNYPAPGDTQQACPPSPACTCLKDTRGRVLYVGKAQSLRNRVRQYLQRAGPRRACASKSHRSRSAT